MATGLAGARAQRPEVLLTLTRLLLHVLRRVQLLPASGLGRRLLWLGRLRCCCYGSAASIVCNLASGRRARLCPPPLLLLLLRSLPFRHGAQLGCRGDMSVTN